MTKSSRNPQEANAIIKAEHSGLYRLHVYNPQQRRRPIGRGTLYITDEEASTPEALQQEQKQQLASAGRLGRSTRKPTPKPEPKSPADRAAGGPTAGTENMADRNPPKEETKVLDDEEYALDGNLENDPFGDMDAVDAALLEEDFDATLDEGLNMEDDILEDMSGLGSNDFEGEFEDLDSLEKELNFDLDEF